MMQSVVISAFHFVQYRPLQLHHRNKACATFKSAGWAGQKLTVASGADGLPIRTVHDG